ncbi:hypothetical protein A9Q84_08365 [Halobacteriovorax marinus]|uniref:Uncharacterized protein n=1 Tax=Halobacteriovorax marinus TaxID=97084 RepID=A0A1Y5FBK9_9BACT|nr:hypothetical protein A9Q84_08365 [Halobacteriovorax marinus]
MNKLIAIYKYKSHVVEGELSGGAYFLMSMLSEDGPLEKNLLDKISNDFFLVSSTVGEDYGPFESLEDLSKFCFSICTELKSPYVTLHSLEEFNALIEKSANLTELLSDLQSEGNLLENVAITQKKSLMQRVFDRV